MFYYAAGGAVCAIVAPASTTSQNRCVPSPSKSVPLRLPVAQLYSPYANNRPSTSVLRSGCMTLRVLRSAMLHQETARRSRNRTPLGTTSSCAFAPPPFIAMSAGPPSKQKHLHVSTRAWRGDCDSDIAEAANALASGKLVAFPTETVYGLGADARNDSAVRDVFAAKGRPSDNPLIVHVPSKDTLSRARLTKTPLSLLADKVTDAFWPGPLTVVLPCLPNAQLSSVVTAGLNSVAIRVPSHPVASALLKAAGIPVAAPSANLSGRPSPTKAHHVLADLAGRVHGVVGDLKDFALSDGGCWGEDSGYCGLESTVVDLTDESRPTILRPGAISAADLERVTGVVFHLHAPTGNEKAGSVPVGKISAPKAPGMKYRHYAPRAPVVLCRLDSVRAEIGRQRVRHPHPARIGLMADEETCAEHQEAVGGVTAVACGVRGDAGSFGRGMYASLRAFDGEGPNAVDAPGVSVIVVVEVTDAMDGIGAAIMNRLRKAASAPLEDGQAPVGDEE
jgi:L-threonylcarbamoyladenylate synthase